MNYQIPEDLHRKAKICAAMSDQTLREFLIEALTDRVRKVQQEQRSK